MLTVAFVESLNEFAAGWFDLFALSTIKLSFLCLVMLMIVRSVKRLSASTRYHLILLTVISGLAIPAMNLFLPPVDIAVNHAIFSSISNQLDSFTKSGNNLGINTGAGESQLPVTAESRAIPGPHGKTISTAFNQPSLFKMFRIKTVLFMLWAVVLLWGLVRLGLGLYYSARIVGRSEAVRDQKWRRLHDECCRQLNINHAVPILLCNNQLMPSIHGIWKSSIVLPAEAINWSYQRCRTVLLHEFAHIARRDCSAQLLYRLSLLVNWFNPILYLAVTQLQVEREKACDNIVLQSGIQSDKYAEELLSIVVQYQRIAGTALGMARGKEIESRIRAILDQTIRRKQITKGAKMLVTTIVITMSTMLSTLAITNDADKSGTSPVTKLSATQSTESGSGQLSEKEIEQLLSDVQSDDPKVREKGIARLEALGGDHPAVVYIIKQLQKNFNSDEELFSRFIPSADKKSRATEHLIKGLSSTLPTKRAAIARSLGQIGDRRAVEPLIPLLEDEHASVREWSARSLGKLADPSAVTPLIASLNDDSYNVREWVVRALRRIGDDRAFGPLIETLKDDHDEVREWAVRALGSMGDERAVDHLIPLINDEDSDVAEWAIRAIGQIEGN